MKTATRVYGALIKGLFLAVLALTGCNASAEPQLGKEYQRLKQPVPVETGKKIEVLELFWYGCPHCYDLDPSLNGWVKKLPADVEFRRQPAVFREEWVPGVKMFYAEEALGLTNKLHSEIFNAIHKNNISPSSDQALLEWVAKQPGVDGKKFADAYNSFAMQGKVARAKQLTRSYGISGVPSVVVDGKYLTSVAAAGSEKAFYETLDHLIKVARHERGGK